jgi:hypothetical protein
MEYKEIQKRLKNALKGYLGKRISPEVKRQLIQDGIKIIEKEANTLEFDVKVKYNKEKSCYDVNVKPKHLTKNINLN